MTISNDALLLLHSFRRYALPGVLRKLNLWKGLNRGNHTDLIEDLEQELWLDCLQNPAAIVALPTRKRHTRWLRLIEASYYHLHVRSERLRASDAPVEALVDGHRDHNAERIEPLPRWKQSLRSPERRFLSRLQEQAHYLKNGRLNCRASARSMGIPTEDLMLAWGRVADGLGFGLESQEFWRRRLVEALIGLAADLLRDDQAVVVHREESRRRPDPKGRLRRIRQLREHLGCRPMPRDLKKVLTRYQTRRLPGSLHPERILADAARLRPGEPAIYLWTFEAALAQGDLPAAARAIRRARRCGAEPVPVLLARARLLEARGKEVAARRILLAGRTRARDDQRLCAALRNLAG